MNSTGLGWEYRRDKEAAMDDCERVLAKLEEVKEHVADRVTSVEEKVDEIATTTGEFALKMTKVVTRLTTMQETCPIHKLNGQLKDIKEDGKETREVAEKALSRSSRSMTMSGILYGLWAALLGFLGFKS